MGGCYCLRKTKPPPNIELVGEWILNPRSKHFHIGTGQFRYKRGTNLLGLGLSGQQNEQSVCRLIIHEDGMITFYEYTPECWVVIDGPVYSWKNRKMKTYANSELSYDDTYVKNNVLIVNGLRLEKTPSTP